MSNIKKSAEFSENFEEEYENYIANIDKKYTNQMDDNLIRRLSDPPKMTSLVEKSPMSKNNFLNTETKTNEPVQISSYQELDSQPSFCVSFEKLENNLHAKKIPNEGFELKSSNLKNIKAGKLSDLNNDYYVIFVEPFIFIHDLNSNTFTKFSPSEFLFDNDSKERVETLSLKKHCGHNVLLILGCNLVLSVMLIHNRENKITLCRFEPKLQQKIKTKTFFYKDGSIYFRAENEVHCLSLGQLPLAFESDYIGSQFFGLYTRQYERFDSFDISENKQNIYILNNDRISANSNTFLLHVFKPRLDINEHIRCINSLAKKFKPKVNEPTVLNDIIFTLTNMSKLFVHDGSLMNKPSEFDFRIARMDLLQVFKLKNTEGSFLEMKLLPKFNLIQLKHSHVKDFFFLKFSNEFLDLESSDLLIVREAKSDSDPPGIAPFDKEQIQKPSSSIKRMSESKKSNLTTSKRIFSIDFFESAFVVLNFDSTVFTNIVICDEKENKNQSFSLQAYGVDKDLSIFRGVLNSEKINFEKVSENNQVSTNLSTIFDKHVKLQDDQQLASPQKICSEQIESNLKTKEDKNSAQKQITENELSDKKSDIQISPNKDVVAEKESTIQCLDEKSIGKTNTVSVETKTDLVETPKEFVNDQPNSAVNAFPTLEQLKELIPSSNISKDEPNQNENTPPKINDQAQIQFPENIKNPSVLTSKTDINLKNGANNNVQLKENPENESIVKVNDQNLLKEKNLKTAKNESKLHKKQNEEFVKCLNNVLMDYHDEGLKIVRSFIDELKQTFSSEIKQTVTENAKFFSKNNYEFILKSIENSLNPSFEKSIKKISDKYTSMCERSISKIMQICDEEDASYKIFEKESNSLLKSQLQTAKNVKTYTDLLIDVTSQIEEQKFVRKAESEEINQVSETLVKIALQQKALNDNFRIIKEKFDHFERKSQYPMNQKPEYFVENAQNSHLINQSGFLHPNQLHYPPRTISFGSQIIPNNAMNITQLSSKFDETASQLKYQEMARLNQSGNSFNQAVFEMHQNVGDPRTQAQVQNQEKQSFHRFN